MVCVRISNKNIFESGRKCHSLFQTSDNVIYGNHGVCCVIGISKIKSNTSDDEIFYYTLRPAYKKEIVVYVPVDNPEFRMRYVLSKNAAESLIQNIPQLSLLEIPTDSTRKSKLKEYILTYDLEIYIRLLKTLYIEKQVFAKDKKRTSALDDMYFNLVEEKILEELEFVLWKSRKQIREFIIDQFRLNQS